MRKDSHQPAAPTTRTTKRKQVEAAFRESERGLRLIFDSVSDGVATADFNAVITKVNQRMLEMLGFNSEDEMLGRSVIEFIAPADREKAALEMQRVLMGRTKTHVECTALKEDGTEFPVEASGTVLKDSSGNPIGFVAIIRDISERKKAEGTLRKSEGKLRLYLERSPDGIYVNDLSGRLLYLNERAEIILGYYREELLGKALTDFPIIPLEYRQKAKRIMDFNQVGRPTYSDEFELVRKDGCHVFVEVSTYPILQRDRPEVIGIIRDITERKQLQEQLLKAERRYRHVLESSRDGIAAADHEGHITECNKAYANMLGYSPKS